jgi:glycerophosphoryl diester phosphodiesterase
LASAKGAILRSDKFLNLPPVIGHRGAAAHAPENTLAGFRKASELGCDWVEFDVRLTADGALVVCHDDRLDRTTDGRGRISKLPLAAIRRCDAGNGEHVPTLGEALSLCRKLGLGANVEIKAEGGQGAATATALAAYSAEMALPPPPILISSFLRDAVAEAAARAPHIPRGMLWRKIPRDWARIAAELGCATIHAGQADLTQDQAAAIVGAGYSLLVYTINDADRARQLYDWGAASVFSDAPDIILAATASAGAGMRRGAIS